MEKDKTKTLIKENEASVRRWLATVVVGFLIGSLIASVVFSIYYIASRNIPALNEGGSWYAYAHFISLILNFVGLFWGTVIAIKKVAKTSIKSFIFGADRTSRVDIKKEVLPFAGLYLLGMVITSVLPFINNISRNNISGAQIAFVIIFSLAFVWMQTSWEELIFRGITLRMTCKNDIKFSKKSIIGCIISALLFMVLHTGNPEVLSLSGIDVFFMVLSYFVPGVLLYIYDVMCGSLLPGMVIHFINNFFAFVLISEEVSAGGATSIWIDHSNRSGFVSMIAVILANVPVLIYLIIKKKKEIEKQ